MIGRMEVLCGEFYENSKNYIKVERGKRDVWCTGGYCAMSILSFWLFNHYMGEVGKKLYESYGKKRFFEKKWS